MNNAPGLTTFILALAVVGAVNAQDPASQTTPAARAPTVARATVARTPDVAAGIDFATIDSNSDGKVTLEEVRYIDDLAAAFEQLDINRDKQLSPAEFAHWGRASKSKEQLDPTTAPSGSNGAQHMPNPN
jgi:EF hand